MYKITKSFSFAAAHQLRGLPAEHPCSRVHGHNYEVIVELSSELTDEVGFVQDYRELETVKNYLDENLDHRNLNDVLPFNPTAEHIAHFLYVQFKDEFPLLTAVSVSETPKTFARYEPPRAGGRS